ncbi:MAG TPA: Asp-tRNA(Asn)/Glu-tRNA(Gln) amidotransferase subunit GatA [bacterium]|nr:Asp-tRNA(Asn)/Glu-tRNA(Gln) amidotransferase subunit GatA [bacterium]
MIKELHQKLINKEISAVELTRDYLARAEAKNSELNAFITIVSDSALRQAVAVDRKIKNNEEISLIAGLPCSIKDVIMTEGIRTTAASKILENYIASYDATSVGKIKNAKAVILGKNNCDEFAMGGSNENSGFGPVKNPLDLERVPGGSSGGSAVSVAADLAVYALGTDTGGSVRQPAAFCGVVGLKPTYGAVSRHGLIAMASSLDQIGPLTKNIEDAKIIFDIIKGKDKFDSTSQEFPISNQPTGRTGFQFPINFKKLKIGIPKEYFVKGIDTEVESAVREVIKKAEALGAEIVEVSLPYTEYALAVYYIIQPAEASANLARFDGIRYGKRAEATENLIEVYKKTRAEFLGEEVKRRIMLGTYTLSAGYFDAYYKKANAVRKLIKQDFTNVFESVDLLITPTTPTSAFKLGEKTSDPLTMYLEDIFTVPINLAGLPAMSMPAGQTKSGLPIGVQLIAPWFGEDVLFEVGEELERVIRNM